MCKLIAATFDMPLMELLEMPDKDYCQSCGMPFYQEADHGSEAGGGRSRDFCSMCYENGAFVRDETMEELIEEAAPHMAACRIGLVLHAGVVVVPGIADGGRVVAVHGALHGFHGVHEVLLAEGLALERKVRGGGQVDHVEAVGHGALEAGGHLRALHVHRRAGGAEARRQP